MRLALPGRTVVITGATGGLGARLARPLRAHGANVALLDLDAEAVRLRAASIPAELQWAADGIRRVEARASHARGRWIETSRVHRRTPSHGSLTKRRTRSQPALRPPARSAVLRARE